MQPQQQDEPQLTRSRSRSHRHSTQPVQAIDVQAHQEPKVEQMTRSRSRRFKSKVLQAPGTTPPAGSNQPQPIAIPPATPDQPRRTADATWDYNKFFRNRQGAEPPAPPPSDGQEPNENPRRRSSNKLSKQHDAPRRKALPARPNKTTGRAHGQLRLVLTKRPIRLRPTLSNQDGNGRQVL